MQSSIDSCSDALLGHATELLHQAGERMTGPRRVVLLALAARGDHASAEQLIADVRGLDRSVHQASVYRSLETLSRCGLVQHVHLGHGATAYHLVESAHPHAQCTTCGRVIDLPAPPFEALTRALREEAEFCLDAAHVALSGTCRDCAAKAERRPR